MERDRVTKLVLLASTLLVSLIFFWMIRQFLLTLLLAGIFSALAQPLYRRLVRRTGGRNSFASALTILFLIFAVLLPLLFLLGIVTAQAVKVSESVTPWIEKYLSEPEEFHQTLQNLPYFEKVRPLIDLAVQKTGEIIAGASSFLIGQLSSVAGATAQALFMIFVLLYSMFFFLKDGDKLLHKIRFYLPLEDKDENLLLDRFVSVSRATLKGTFVIGFLQGGLAGLAFWAVGISSAAFWGVLMAVMSVIPGIGTALVWVPAVIVLALEGNGLRAAGLLAWCVVVVGSIDNLLRPILVGKDTKMHELLIFLGTMGGIFLFGAVGFIIGPVVAALFVTVWDMYGVAFKDVLPAAGGGREEGE